MRQRAIRASAHRPTLEEFLSDFRFDPSRAWHMGVERERFITTRLGTIVPSARAVLERLELLQPGSTGASALFGYELSAAQIEGRTKPCRTIKELRNELAVQDELLDRALAALGLCQSHIEVAPTSMPLDVYPDPRYLEISATVPREILAAACRVIGTHVHIGMPDLGSAIQTYNRVIKKTGELIEFGDGSQGERMRLYRMMAPACMPVPFEDASTFYEYAREQGFATNLRNNWSLIRITKSGTIEFRMFGATNDISLVCAWTWTCLDVCHRAF